MLYEGTGWCGTGEIFFLFCYRWHSKIFTLCLVAKRVYGLWAILVQFWQNFLTFIQGVETAAFPGQQDEEVDRLLHMVGIIWPSYIHFLWPLSTYRLSLVVDLLELSWGLWHPSAWHHSSNLNNTPFNLVENCMIFLRCNLLHPH